MERRQMMFLSGIIVFMLVGHNEPGVHGTTSCIKNFLTGSDSIPDSALSASSSWDSYHGPHRGRLYTPRQYPNRGAWSAAYNNLSQWIQADLQTDVEVTGVITQGRVFYGQWVTKFAVSYSTDCNDWTTIAGYCGSEKIFTGNFDGDTTVSNLLPCPVRARCIRILPREWYNQISVRFDVVGCSLASCVDSFLTGSNRIPDSALTASSFWDVYHGPERARLDTVDEPPYRGAWSAATPDQNQWIQADLQEEVAVTGVTLLGRLQYNQYVKECAVSYSVDCSNWNSLSETCGSEQLFPGNAIKTVAVTNMFSCPLRARCIRIHPRQWHGNDISLRFDIQGCHLGTGNWNSGGSNVSMSFENLDGNATVNSNASFNDTVYSLKTDMDVCIYNDSYWESFMFEMDTVSQYFGLGGNRQNEVQIKSCLTAGVTHELVLDGNQYSCGAGTFSVQVEETIPDFTLPSSKTVNVTIAEVMSNEVEVLDIELTNVIDCNPFSCNITCVNSAQSFEFATGTTTVITNVDTLDYNFVYRLSVACYDGHAQNLTSVTSSCDVTFTTTVTSTAMTTEQPVSIVASTMVTSHKTTTTTMSSTSLAVEQSTSKTLTSTLTTIPIQTPTLTSTLTTIPLQTSTLAAFTTAAATTISTTAMMPSTLTSTTATSSTAKTTQRLLTSTESSSAVITSRDSTTLLMQTTLPATTIHLLTSTFSIVSTTTTSSVTAVSGDGFFEDTNKVAAIFSVAGIALLGPIILVVCKRACSSCPAKPGTDRTTCNKEEIQKEDKTVDKTDSDSKSVHRANTAGSNVSRSSTASKHATRSRTGSRNDSRSSIMSRESSRSRGRVTPIETNDLRLV